MLLYLAIEICRCISWAAMELCYIPVNFSTQGAEQRGLCLSLHTDTTFKKTKPKIQLFLQRAGYSSADSILVLLEFASLKIQVIIRLEM